MGYVFLTSKRNEMQEPLLVNNRYLINPEKNSLTDTSTNQESRIEQRLLEVLYLLAARPNELVTREEIIRTVWNDYGGADEGLTQAISFLRKVLNDSDKKIIETIPKKGYILNASVRPATSMTDEAQIAPDRRRSSGISKYLIGLILVVVALVIVYLTTWSDGKNTYSPDVIPPQEKKGEDNPGPASEQDTVKSGGADVIPDSVRRLPQP
jgi:DNA-binding winged helix-turn-helix (wHTH) protein